MRFLQRSYQRFQSSPASAKYAIVVIMSVTMVVVVLGALLMWTFDRDNYPSYGQAVWFTLQTVTTVGYGDTTPTSAVGRTVAGFVMLTGIGLITVVTAAVTSLFIEAARVRMAKSRADTTAEQRHPLERMEASLREISERLERLESSRGAEDRERHQP